MDGFVNGVLVGVPAMIEAVGLMRIRVGLSLAFDTLPLWRRRGDSIVLREVCQGLVDIVLSVTLRWDEFVADLDDQADTGLASRDAGAETSRSFWLLCGGLSAFMASQASRISPVKKT